MQPQSVQQRKVWFGQGTLKKEKEKRLICQCHIVSRIIDATNEKSQAGKVKQQLIWSEGQLEKKAEYVVSK